MALERVNKCEFHGRGRLHFMNGLRILRARMGIRRPPEVVKSLPLFWHFLDVSFVKDFLYTRK